MLFLLSISMLGFYRKPFLGELSIFRCSRFSCSLAWIGHLRGFMAVSGELQGWDVCYNSKKGTRLEGRGDSGREQTVWWSGFLDNLVPSFSRPYSVLFLALFKFLVKFLSFRFQQHEGRLMMAQGVQPTPAESGRGPCRSLEKPSRDVYTSRVG